MPADYKQMELHFRQFYDLSAKTVVAVGAGGGPFTDLVCEAPNLIVIDKEPAAIRRWEETVAEKGLHDRVRLIQRDFCAVTTAGDVVYFEFCLHEMDDPAEALRHALAVAPEVVVFDHLPDSQWAFLAAEDDKIACSTATLARFRCLRKEVHRTEQRFENYQQLVERVRGQGELALRRAERYREDPAIAIPMTYGLFLLNRAGNQ